MLASFLFFHSNAIPCIHIGDDYIVNIQNSSSKTFTVAFQSKQANSTEHVIRIVDDNIYEGIESFRLRILRARFIGQAAELFTPEDLTNIFATVNIADNDCECRALA